MLRRMPGSPRGVGIAMVGHEVERAVQLFELCITIEPIAGWKRDVYKRYAIIPVKVERVMSIVLKYHVEIVTEYDHLGCRSGLHSRW